LYDKWNFRRRSIDNIIEELLIAKTLPFVKFIKFDDDAFLNLSVEKIREFSKKYKEKIGLILIITGATPSTLSEEKLSLLVDAGLRGFRLGIQTASKPMRKLLNIPHSIKQIKKAAKLINKYQGVGKITHIQYDILLDIPWETDKDKVKTLMFLSRLPVPYRLSLCSLICFPGTALYEKAKSEGIITDDLTQIYRRFIHRWEDTYLNHVFVLLDSCTRFGVRIPPWLMFILTSKIVRRLKLNLIIFEIVAALLKRKCKQPKTDLAL
jgi:radical SAM superfamily enzyme YgiQ (UPF0313 family)